MKKSYIIGGIVVLAAMVMAMYSFKSTLTSYVTVSEAKASKRPVQVAGIVVKGYRQIRPPEKQPDFRPSRRRR